jgi:hypothetical protein
VIGRERFEQGLRKRQERLEEALARLAELRARRPNVELSVRLIDVWPTLTVEEKRTILSAAIDAVMIRKAKGAAIDARTKILWRGEAPSDVPRRGFRPPLKSFNW